MTKDRTPEDNSTLAIGGLSSSKDPANAGW